MLSISLANVDQIYSRVNTPFRRSQRHLGSDGRYYRKSIEIIDTYKSIDTFDTRKKYR